MKLFEKKSRLLGTRLYAVFLQYSNIWENGHQGKLEGQISVHSQSKAWKDFELEHETNENVIVLAKICVPMYALLHITIWAK